MGVGYSFESIQLRGIDDTSGGQGAMDRHLGRLLPLLLVTFFLRHLYDDCDYFDEEGSETLSVLPCPAIP